MPNGEKSVGRHLFLSSFGFNWKGHTQLQEAEDGVQKHYFKTEQLQHEWLHKPAQLLYTYSGGKLNLKLIWYDYWDLIIVQIKNKTSD